MMQPPNLDTESFLSSPRLHSTNRRKDTSFYHHYPDTSCVYQVSHENTTNSDVVSNKVAQGATNGSLLKHSGEEDTTVTTTPADDEAAEVGFLPVLKNRNFLALWSGQVFSQLADKVYLVLMIAIISTRFQASNQSISGWVSAIMMAFTIPAVLFGSVAGVFVDRWSTKAVLVVTNLVRGGLVLSIPVLLWMTQDWSAVGSLPTGFAILLVLSFLVSTLTQFFAPAEQAAIPLIVERRHLLSANSLYTTTMMALVVVGFAVGEPLLAIADSLTRRFGSEIGKELVVGGSYAIAGCLLMLLKTGEKNRETEEAPHIWQDLRDGLEYLRKNHRIRTALIQLVILFSIFAALAVLAVRMAEVIPQMKSSQFGFLLAAGGLGIAAGATLLGQYGQRISPIQLSLYGSVGIAGCLIGLAIFTEQLLAVLLLITLLGGFASLVAIPMQTAIQKETSPEMRGKIFGLQNNVINIALTLPLALAGVAETFIGLQAVFLSLAAAAIAGGILTWYICRTET
ncbi:MFS transporter [Chroogloeocystis siderophila]|jgi:MFS family permease|uniref:Arabinose efflux permease n=1 Tax=Chroogloeocystis siderophila 5.2 s.c.1 TaxID=247279 RepID=A0A1U7HUH5_9CHRO|nr:MFS transporter [Chroogloeocystis siderophila]OKH27263.1 arabinose efflux permease [Chroogloeocystis siderophila 5.2 s.c.1]